MYGPATLTNPTRVAAVVKLVNSLSMAVPSVGFILCPEDNGGSMQVDFADRSGRLADQMQIELTGCAGIQITAADGATGMLGNVYDHGKRLDGMIMSLLGLDWPIYTH